MDGRTLPDTDNSVEGWLYRHSSINEFLETGVRSRVRKADSIGEIIEFN